MNLNVWKSGIFVVVFILLHCVNDPPSTIHPVLTLQEERLNDTTSLVFISSTDAQEYSLHRIVDDTCMLVVTYHAIIGGIEDTYDSIIPIPNDSAAFAKGTFYGTWKAEFSDVEIGDNTIQVDTLQIFGCVTDETGHEACGLLTLLGDTTSVK